MRKELSDKLIKDFPNLFSIKDGLAPWAMFGFECADGWEPSIRKTAEKLENLIIVDMAKNKDDAEYMHPRTSQIKEKYGVGCWYMDYGTDEMWQAVTEWENLTASICEQCGAPGKLRGTGWFYTACIKCAKPEDRDNIEYLEMKHKEKINE